MKAAAAASIVQTAVAAQKVDRTRTLQAKQKSQRITRRAHGTYVYSFGCFLFCYLISCFQKVVFNSPALDSLPQSGSRLRSSKPRSPDGSDRGEPATKERGRSIDLPRSRRMSDKRASSPKTASQQESRCASFWMGIFCFFTVFGC